MSFYLSKHASKRALDMGLDTQTIDDLLNRPDITRNGRAPGLRVYDKGDLTAIVAESESGRRVVTFLVRGGEQAWRRYRGVYVSGKHFDGGD